MSQNHPLYAQDRAIMDRLLAAAQPDQQDIVDAARLLIRYDVFPGADDIRFDLDKCLRGWNLTRSELNRSARTIWESGYRPMVREGTEVGSGADVNAA